MTAERMHFRDYFCKMIDSDMFWKYKSKYELMLHDKRLIKNPAQLWAEVAGGWRVVFSHLISL